MKNDIELRLIAPNSEAIKSIRQVATESEKLYKNNEKNQKREKGLIEDIEEAMDDLQKKRKQAFTVGEIEKYNKKLAEAKQHLDEYNKAGVATEKKTQSMTQTVGKWALSLGGVATALNLIKEALMNTTWGMNAFNIASAAAKNVIQSMISGFTNLGYSIASVVSGQKELNKLRIQERKDHYEATKLQIIYNQKISEAHDQLKTATERIKAYDEAIEAHKERFAFEIDSAEKRVNALTAMFAGDLDNEKLEMALWDAMAQLENLKAQRESGLKEITSMRSGLIKSELDEVQKGITEEHEMLIDSYLEKRDMFFDFVADIEKANEEAAKRAEKAREREWDFEMKYANLIYKQQEDSAKAIWDAILEDERIAKEEAEDLQEARLEALKQGLNELLEFTQTITDRALEDAQRHRGILDQRISETQAALQIEVELYKEGYASNVDAKKKELAELKAQRDKALKDEEAALKRQRQMESIAQGVNIFSSATNILKSSTKLGPLGLILAAGAITAMFALLSSVKKRSSEIRLASGGRGEVKGRLHSEGGERFLDHVEVEAGERWGVLSRPASRKYGKAFYEMVDSFNKNKPSIPRAGIMINNINNDGPNKRLDEVNSNLRRIHAKEEVLTVGTAVIYKKGSSTRVIKRR